MFKSYLTTIGLIGSSLNIDDRLLQAHIQELIATKAKGNKDKDFWKKLEYALDNGLIFQNLCCRLPMRGHLENLGWVEQNETNLRGDFTMINHDFEALSTKHTLSSKHTLSTEHIISSEHRKT